MQQQRPRSTSRDTVPVMADEEIDLERSSHQRRRSLSPPSYSTSDERRGAAPPRGDYRGDDDRQDDGSVNQGNNLHVSGLSPRTRDDDLEREFSKFGK
ncbi:hypothetical protein HK405_002575, partial [Cladochytrium tenue]